MKRKVLVTRAVFPEAIEALEQRFEVVGNPDDTPWSPDQIAVKLAGCDAAMSTVMCKFDASVFERNPQLKVVSNIAVGYNNIDVRDDLELRGLREDPFVELVHDGRHDAVLALQAPHELFRPPRTVFGVVLDVEALRERFDDLRKDAAGDEDFLLHAPIIPRRRSRRDNWEATASCPARCT